MKKSFIYSKHLNALLKLSINKAIKVSMYKTLIADLNKWTSIPK